MPSTGDRIRVLEVFVAAMSEPPDDVCPQSAAIPFRIEIDKPRILLITSRRSKRWIVPKGIVEDWQSPKQTALAEAYEEAGVRGLIVGAAIGTYDYEKWGCVYRVSVFLMRVDDVLSSWPESEVRDRMWVDIDKALQVVDNRDLQRLIKHAVSSMK